MMLLHLFEDYCNYNCTKLHSGPKIWGDIEDDLKMEEEAALFKGLQKKTLSIPYNPNGNLGQLTRRDEKKFKSSNWTTYHIFSQAIWVTLW